jgi:hypothetical protein
VSRPSLEGKGAETEPEEDLEILTVDIEKSRPSLEGKGAETRSTVMLYEKL